MAKIFVLGYLLETKIGKDFRFGILIEEKKIWASGANQTLTLAGAINERGRGGGGGGVRNFSPS